MLHSIRMPAVHRSSLRELLLLQIRLLRWASGNEVLSEQSCAEWLGRTPKLRSVARGIAHWLWNSSARHSLLEEFADGPADAKNLWTDTVIHDNLSFGRRLSGELGRHDSSEPAWMISGANWLRNFYQDWRSESGIPQFCLPVTGRSYSGQDFLAAFRTLNSRLEICPFCDENGYYTIAERGNRAGIDHFLPKEVYPQLACHPFNLVPMCPFCNSFVKLRRNPLDPAKRLEEIWLPYRKAGISRSCNLVVNYVADGFQFGVISGEGLFASPIEILDRVFEIPGRWRERKDYIGSRLTRDMRHYFRANGQVDWKQGLEQVGDELRSELGRDSFVFAKIGWVNALLGDANQNGDQSDAFLWIQEATTTP
jgi:hypothetical protein